MNYSPFSQLYRSIVAEMVANGTPFADSAAEIAFRTWIKSAWLDSGCTSDFAVLYQPATSTTFSVGVRVATSGHKVNVWWGDGTSGSYAPVPDSNTTVSKTWGSAAKRPIVVLGRVTRLEAGGQAFGGRLWANLRSLAYLSCGGCSSVTGSINSLPSGLTLLACVGCTVTYAASSGTRTWANNMRCVSINPPSAGTWTSAMQDAILIDLAAVATWTTEKTLSLAGDCGARTSASNAAYATLQTKGLTTLAVN